MMTTPERAKLTIHEVFAYLRVRDAAQAIDFCARAFGAQEVFRLSEPSGLIGHAEIKLGATTVMLSDEYPECDIRGPRSVGGTSVAIHLHVSDVDRLFDRAVAARATVVRPLKDQFYGERSGTVRDPFGHELLGAHVYDVSREEMQRRYTALLAGE